MVYYNSMYNSMYNSIYINLEGNLNLKFEGYGDLSISFILDEANFNRGWPTKSWWEHPLHPRRGKL